MSRINKVLKLTGWENPDIVETASDINRLGHTTVRTARRTSTVHPMHVIV